MTVDHDLASGSDGNTKMGKQFIYSINSRLRGKE